MAGNPTVKKLLRALPSRFGFTIEKDINLLKVALSLNPWQLGSDKWKDVTSELRTRYSYNLTERTVKERIQLLIRKFQKDELTTKTGTQEERTERSLLIETIVSIIEEEIKTPANREDLSEMPELVGCTSLNQEEWQDSSTSNQSSLAAPGLIELSPLPTASSSSNQFTAKKETNHCFPSMSPDTSVNESVASKLYYKFIVEESSRCRKRHAEEELMRQKFEHDMEMERKRFRLEEEKLLMEKRRLEIEAQREARLAEDSRRNGEILQMLMQLITAKKSSD